MVEKKSEVRIESIKSGKVEGAAMPPAASSVPPAARRPQATGGQYQAKGLGEMLGRASSPSGLGMDAEEYIRALQIQCIDKTPELSYVNIRTTTYEAMVVYNKSTKEAIALMFGETYESFSDIPVTRHLADNSETGLINQINTHIEGGARLIHAVVVEPSDYPRTKQMASYLTNVLVQRGEAEKLGAAQFAAANLVVDCNIDRVRQFFDKTSPHSLAARCDIGFVLALQTPQSFTNTHNPEMHEQPFLAVGGFVEVIRVPASYANQHNNGYLGGVNQNDFVYKPIIRITELQTQLYSTFVFPLAVAIMADAFIGKYRWMSAFGFGEGKPNLGNVLLDEKTKGKTSTFFVQQQAEQAEVLQKYYKLPPDIAVDVLEGRATHPAVNTLVNRPQHGRIIEKIAAMLGKQVYSTLTRANWPIVEGSVVWANKKTDSRQVDYFNMACNTKDASPFMTLMDKSMQPLDRVNNVRTVLGSMEVIYSGHEVVLHPEFVNSIINGMTLNLTYKQPGPLVDHGTRHLVDAGEINAALPIQGGGYQQVSGISSPFITDSIL